MSKVEVISEYLDFVIPDPKCELNYKNDWQLLIAVMLSAQTTDKRVNIVTEVLFDKYSSLESLKTASVDDIEVIIKSLGSFRKKASYIKDIATILIDKYDGIMPKSRELLEELPGVGRKTVSVVLSELYNYPEFAVDTHVDRVSKRLSLAADSDSVLVIEVKLKKKFKKNEWSKRHKQLVLFGRYHCKAVSPMCDECGIKNICRGK